jgi:hypothetical protein
MNEKRRFSKIFTASILVASNAVTALVCVFCMSGRAPAPESLPTPQVGDQNRDIHTSPGGEFHIKDELTYFPPGPEFKLRQQVQAMEEYKLRQQGVEVEDE